MTYSDMDRFAIFTTMHWMPIVLVLLFMIFVSNYAKDKTFEKQRRIGTILALIPLILLILRRLVLVLKGINLTADELPFHLCNILSIVMPYFMWKVDRHWLAISYFLLGAGTIQAIISPDLLDGPRYFEYYAYFISHTVLVGLAYYIIVVYNIRPTIRDLFGAFLVANVFLIFSIIVNYFLGTNFFYSMHKPDGFSPLDYFGPWPWYLLVCELLALLLFFIAYLPVLWLNKGEQVA